MGGLPASYLAPEGTPFPQRSLPRTTKMDEYHIYEVKNHSMHKSGSPLYGLAIREVVSKYTWAMDVLSTRWCEMASCGRFGRYG